MLRYDAFKQIVEDAWDAPLNPPATLNTTKFTLANTAFPTSFRRTMGKTVKPEDRRVLIPIDGYQDPLLIEEGSNVIFAEDDPPLIQLRHLDKNGNLFDHKEHLLSKTSILQHLKNEQPEENKFRCPIPECMGYLYPEELESAFSKKLTLSNGSEVGFELNADQIALLVGYKKQFYKVFKTRENNNTENNTENNLNNNNIPSISGLFHEMEDGTCSTGRGGGAGGPNGGAGDPEGGNGGGGGAGGHKGGYRKNKKRKSIKHRKYNRKTRKNNSG
jgi:hypothetical protein